MKRKHLFSLSCLAFALLLFSGAARAQTIGGLISEWKADGNANDSVGTNNGVASGDTTYVTGQFGSAFNFGGAGLVTVPADPSLDPQQISIEAWIKPNFAGRGSDGDVDTIMGSFPYILAINQQAGRVYKGSPAPLGAAIFQLYINGRFYECQSTNAVSNDGKFHHVAATFDGFTMRVYVDGVVGDTTIFATSGTPGALANWGQPVTIGFVTPPARYSQAAIDDVKLFGRGLTASEVSSEAQVTPVPGGIFVTGHDPDFHAFPQNLNAPGAVHTMQAAISYVTNGITNPRILLVTDLRNPGGTEIDSREGLIDCGFSTFDVAIADIGDPVGPYANPIFDVNLVDFTAYDVVVVASDYGGWLHQAELDVLKARQNDIMGFVNQGGGLVALAECGLNNTTTHDRFGFLPFLAGNAPFEQVETTLTVTAFGTDLGLTDADVNGNFCHTIFTPTVGMEPVDMDGAGNIISFAERGQTVSTGGLGVTQQTALPIITGGFPLTGGIYGPGDGMTAGQVTRTITGTGVPGDQIQITVKSAMGSDNFTVPPITVQADGTWSYNLTLFDCAPEVDITQTLSGGGSPSAPFIWTGYVDGTPPHFLNGGPVDGTEQLPGGGGAAVIILNGGASDAGSFVPNDGVSYQWRLYDGPGGYNGPYTVIGGGAGDPSILDYSAGPGDYYFEVDVTDSAGNVLQGRCHHHVIRPLTITSGLADGSLQGPGATPDAGQVAWTVNGTGDPGCTIQMSFTDLMNSPNPAPISTTVAADGTWSLNPDLMDCSYDVVVTQICPDATETITRHTYVDGTAPVFTGGGTLDVTDYAGTGGTATHLLTGGATDETYYPGNGVSYQWYSEGSGGALTPIAGATNPNLTVTDPVGDYYYDVIATDSAGNKRTRRCHHQVLVTLPAITNCGVGTDSLWPPNHDLINVGLNYTVVPGTYPVAAVTVIVYSNEPDLGPDGDDNFSPDARGSTAGALRLRSERGGQSNGRVYLVVITATDTRGNKATCCHGTVTVPHDQSKASKDLVANLAAGAAAYAEANNGTPPSGYVHVGNGPVVGPKQ